MHWILPRWTRIDFQCDFRRPYHTKLESSQRPQTCANAMLFARWQHHIRFGSVFPYAPLKAMLTKISKWSRILDSFRITPKIESLVVFAISDIPRKVQKDPSITFWVILLTHRQTNKLWQKHNLLGGGKHQPTFKKERISKHCDVVRLYIPCHCTMYSFMTSQRTVYEYMSNVMSCKN